MLSPKQQNIIEKIIHLTINQNLHADKAIQHLFDAENIEASGEKQTIARIAYDIIRWYRLLVYLQALHGDKNIFHTYFKQIGHIEKPVMSGSLNLSRAMRYAIPDWLDDLAYKELGEEWEKELCFLQTAAPVYLRVNTLKNSPEELTELLDSEGVVVKKLKNHPYALVINEYANVFNTKAFQKGLFEVQDAGSQLIAPMLDVSPGMRVIDGCAGNGGKTLHLADLMKNKGKIIALDISEAKLKTIQIRASRAGINIIEPRLITSTKVVKRLNSSAQRVLLDVPCSGLGVLRRNPDIKYHLTPTILEEIKNKQYDLLKRYSLMVKPGGRLLYSTCSILPSENQQQVQHFLSESSCFKLVEEKNILPSQTGYDGFYMALMLREE